MIGDQQGFAEDGLAFAVQDRRTRLHGFVNVGVASERDILVLEAALPPTELLSLLDAHHVSGKQMHQTRDGRLTLELIAVLEKEYRIDPKRLYLTGLSMGGYGTWDLSIGE